MDLGTVFKLSLYGLTAIVGTILGAAEGEGAGTAKSRYESLLPFMSLPIVVCGYLFTESHVNGRSTSSGRGLSSGLANVLAVIALIATAREFVSENREGKLLAGAHLLLYAAWIVLFQQKTIRLYWFLMALGILQLAVSSVLTSKGWFGFSAIGYMFGAVWTLSIFSLWRAEQLFEQGKLGELSSDSHSTQSDSEVRSSVHHEEGTHWLTPRFVTGVLMTTCSALIVSAAFFAFIPRVWVGAELSLQEDQDAVTAALKRTGMPSSVKLGDLGRILQSSERVFEIQLFSARGSNRLDPQKYAELLGMAEPLFRGNVFTEYRFGTWIAEHGANLHTHAFHRDLEVRTSREGEVLQLVRLEPTSSNVLFTLGQPILISLKKNNQPYGNYNSLTNVASRTESRPDSSVFEYHATTIRPAQQQMDYIVPVTADEQKLYKRSRYLIHNTELHRGLGRLETLAGELIQKEVARRQHAEQLSQPRDLTPHEIASAFEHYLRDPHHFKYTLDLQIMDPKVDPIEDFLFNRKAGHCEYFASALALMLRTARIPSRVVSGYKGGVEKSDGFSLEIQQRFAHLWVEAWVDNEGWTTFDPTPPDGRSQSLAELESKLKPSLWTGMQTTLSGLWSENVLNMSLARQEQSIYKPMRELGLALLQFFQQLFTSPQSAFETLWSLLKNRDQWLSLGGFLFGSALLAVLGLTAWLARRLGARWFAWFSRRIQDKHRQRRRIIAFYERFGELMRTKGLKREPAQTQHEFAELVKTVYFPELSGHGLEAAPDQISQLFYRVRFGEQDPSATEMSQLEEVLNKLELALSNESNHRRTDSNGRTNGQVDGQKSVV